MKPHIKIHIVIQLMTMIMISTTYNIQYRIKRSRKSDIVIMAMYPSERSIICKKVDMISLHCRALSWKWSAHLNKCIMSISKYFIYKARFTYNLPYVHLHTWLNISLVLCSNYFQYVLILARMFVTLYLCCRVTNLIYCQV